MKRIKRTVCVAALMLGSSSCISLGLSASTPQLNTFVVQGSPPVLTHLSAPILLIKHVKFPPGADALRVFLVPPKSGIKGLGRSDLHIETVVRSGAHYNVAQSFTLEFSDDQIRMLANGTIRPPLIVEIEPINYAGVPIRGPIALEDVQLRCIASGRMTECTK